MHSFTRLERGLAYRFSKRTRLYLMLRRKKQGF